MNDQNQNAKADSGTPVTATPASQDPMIRHLVFAVIVGGLSLFLFSKVGKSLPGVAIGVSFTVIALSQGFYAFQARRNKQEIVAPSAQSLEIEARYLEGQSKDHRSLLAFAWYFGLFIHLSLALILALLVATTIFGCAVMVVFGLPWWGDVLAQLIASALTIYVLSFWRGVISGIRQMKKPKYRFRLHSDR